MDERAIAVLVTLVAYKLALLGLGLLAQRRTRDETDFFLGGRQLGPLVAAISASASSSSAWTLLGVSGYAYHNGLSAVWIFPSCVGGFALNWYLVAPRLRRLSAATGALTVTEILAGPPGRPLRGAINAVASAIVLFSLMVYVAYQFRGAGDSFEATFGLDPVLSILIGAGIVIAYTLLGGFWAVSLTDTLQGLVMAATAVVLPVLALVAVGGPAGLGESLAGADPAFGSWTHGLGGGAAIGLILGLFGIGLGYPGQPHVVNRFMALRDDRAVGHARRIAMAWAVVVYAGMILLGLCARVLFAAVEQDQVFIAAANELCHPIVAGVMLAAVLSAIMSTADSQLLVAGSAVSHDLRAAGTRQLCWLVGLATVVAGIVVTEIDVGRDPSSMLVADIFGVCLAGGGVAMIVYYRRRGSGSLLQSRAVVLGLSIAATLVAIYATESIFRGVLFAWTAMGAAFGPLLLLTLWRGTVPPLATLLTIVVGFTLSVVAHSFLELSGPARGVVERVVPFAAAFAVALGVGAAVKR